MISGNKSHAFIHTTTKSFHLLLIPQGITSRITSQERLKSEIKYSKMYNTYAQKLINISFKVK